ncbi:ComEC/Rec2 family competence protein [Sediminibacter sp. Hel_I_10]|uniref:ComEC/Rec2 family competence protein n=1 Tax=Sediminibacter sp. Hel_I_10 TaxID=1392490 RepID=UPI00047871F5|nr:ComEC/Rec2 family competence protein [Sediminibacter sp. Hel_I_10]
MKLLNFTIIKLTICLIIGILIAEFSSCSLTLLLWLLSLCLAGTLISFVIAKYQLEKTVWFGAFSFSSMICLGMTLHQLQDPRLFKTHYSHHISEEKESDYSITFKVRERLKPTAYHDKYVITVLEIEGKQVKGQTLLNISKDSLNIPLKVDDVFLTISNLTALKAPLNPNQFDYKHYLEHRQMYHQIYTDQTLLLPINSESVTLFGYADKLRTHINKKLKSYAFQKDELAIINALILGQRQDMSKVVYDTFVNAGVIHILAVSGLHVGIVLWLFSILLKPLERFKYGKTFNFALLIILLWSFALIAGLSASITRAVTMFTIITFATYLKKPTNIYNTLAISMLLLLLFKPMFLFDVGFQLSYVAVFAIVSIQPLLYRLWQPKWKLTNYFWNILTVTMAAQLGVAPLALYYFHQFPALFFISNMAIVPFLGGILALGILVIVLAVLNVLPNVIADLYSTIISLMNTIVTWVAEQESFLFKNISFETPQLLTCYVLLIAFVLWFKKPKFNRLVVVLISMLLVQGAYVFQKFQNSDDTLIIFHKSKASIIAYKNAQHLAISHNLDQDALRKNRVLNDFYVGNFIETTASDSLRSLYYFKRKSLFVVDSFAIYQINAFQPEVVLFRNSPKLNLNRLIDSLQPKLIVADGSNYRSYVNRWRATCLKRKIPFHHTAQEGAYVMK